MLCELYYEKALLPKTADTWPVKKMLISGAYCPASICDTN